MLLCELFNDKESIRTVVLCTWWILVEADCDAISIETVEVNLSQIIASEMRYGIIQFDIW